MRREIHIRFDLSIPPRTLVLGLAAILLVTAAADLGSENVTLTTYYPAPSGVYTKMITTDNTYLARDAGNVGIGTTNPTSKLSVNGGVYVNGNMGIGDSAPAYPLSVVGSARLSGNVPGGKRGYLYIDNTNSGCTWPPASYAGNGPVCAAGQYATWFPGIYIAGYSYQNRGGQIRANRQSGGWTTQVRALDPKAPGSEAWATLAKNDTAVNVYCCPK